MAADDRQIMALVRNACNLEEESRTPAKHVTFDLPNLRSAAFAMRQAVGTYPLSPAFAIGDLRLAMHALEEVETTALTQAAIASIQEVIEASSEIR
jgi:hypothetical protein